VNRRNERWAAIIGAWARAIAPEPETTVAVLPATHLQNDSVGGDFVLAQTTAYSRVAR
jgi:hypothetical protein